MWQVFRGLGIVSGTSRAMGRPPQYECQVRCTAGPKWSADGQVGLGRAAGSDRERRLLSNGIGSLMRLGSTAFRSRLIPVFSKNFLDFLRGPGIRVHGTGSEKRRPSGTFGFCGAGFGVLAPRSVAMATAPRYYLRANGESGQVCSLQFLLWIVKDQDAAANGQTVK